MKRLLYILALLPLGLNSQNMYNVSSLFENGLMGTARYVGMGGSMSALGADLSTMGTNPAGMAMYRSNDISITAGLESKNNKSTYEGTTVKSSKTNAFLGNTAFVFSLEKDGDVLKYLNFGLGYRRKNGFAGIFETSGNANGFSQQYVMDQLYRSSPFNSNNITNLLYEGFNVSWLPLLAADAGLADESGQHFITYPDTTLVWQPDELAFYEETRGGVYVVDLNLAANINDRIYLGATVALSIVDYSRYTEYVEAAYWGDIYVLENNKYLKGNGFDLKLGAIFRPFMYSPFRIGLSIHTPTWYRLNEYSSATITGLHGYCYSTTEPELFGNILSVPSALRTPWRVNASLAYTFGSYLALNAEYEFVDYTKSKFMGRGQVVKAQNEEIACNMKPQHIVRLGAELNFAGMALRAGYNYITAPFAETAYKYIYNAAVTETSTEYINRFGKNIVTLGCGYRSAAFYYDFAYMLETQKSEFYPFYDMEYVNPGANVNHTNHSFIATVGMRF